MNFVAMDFETANHEKHSAVSMALAVVRQNEVVDEFYSLIQPETYFSARNTAIHGIREQDVAGAKVSRNLGAGGATIYRRQACCGP